MDNPTPINLTLFFTRGISLQTWDAIGSLEREVALYQQLQKQGVQVAFVTYGNAKDLEYVTRLPGIKILCNRWGWPNAIYEKLLPFWHAAWLRRSHVIKTNQMDGADVALRAARWWRKPFIARCGFMWSENATRGGIERQAEAKRARFLEAKTFSMANQVVVTTPKMRDYVVQQYHVPPAKVEVIPNYVLTDLFSPDPKVKPVANRLCFVGRLSQIKNPLNLVQACAGLDVELVMVGEGPLRQSLVELAQELKVNLRLISKVPHLELPDLLRQSAIFLLISQIEGHPKVLLEAMACGVPVIGADSPGIRELIRHGETGWLCSTDPGSIQGAIQELLAHPELRTKMGHQARQFVVNNFSLNQVVDQEIALLQSVLDSAMR